MFFWVVSAPREGGSEIQQLGWLPGALGRGHGQALQRLWRAARHQRVVLAHWSAAQAGLERIIAETGRPWFS